MQSLTNEWKMGDSFRFPKALAGYSFSQKMKNYLMSSSVKNQTTLNKK